MTAELLSLQSPVGGFVSSVFTGFVSSVFTGFVSSVFTGFVSSVFTGFVSSVLTGFVSPVFTGFVSIGGKSVFWGKVSELLPGSVLVPTSLSLPLLLLEAGTREVLSSLHARLPNTSNNRVSHVMRAKLFIESLL